MNWLKTLFVLLLLSGCSDATPTSVDSASSGSQPADAASKSELRDSQTTITPAEFSKVAAANSSSDADTDTDANTDANTETGAMLLVDRPENPNRLTIGDPAPPLKITTWLKGQPVI